MNWAEILGIALVFVWAILTALGSQPPKRR